MHDCPGPRKPHAVKRPARPYKSAIQTDFLWKALRALNRPWAARTVPQCSCSSSKAARASACSSQTQRSPTFGQPSRRPVIAAASHRGGRLRFLTQVPNRREPKRERAQERDSSIERELNRERDSPRERGLKRGERDLKSQDKERESSPSPAGQEPASAGQTSTSRQPKVAAFARRWAGLVLTRHNDYVLKFD